MAAILRLRSAISGQYLQQRHACPPEGQSKAEQIMQDRLFNKDNISALWNRQVADVLGDDTGHWRLVLPMVGMTKSYQSTACL